MREQFSEILKSFGLNQLNRNKYVDTDGNYFELIFSFEQLKDAILKSGSYLLLAIPEFFGVYFLPPEVHVELKNDFEIRPEAFDRIMYLIKATRKKIPEAHRLKKKHIRLVDQILREDKVSVLKRVIPDRIIFIIDAEHLSQLVEEYPLPSE